jgi:hypothetical protein
MVDVSAQLRLMRTLQVRLNAHTAGLEARREGASLSDSMQASAGRLAERQADLAEMARRVGAILVRSEEP